MSKRVMRGVAMLSLLLFLSYAEMGTAPVDALALLSFAARRLARRVCAAASNAPSFIIVDDSPLRGRKCTRRDQKVRSAVGRQETSPYSSERGEGARKEEGDAAAAVEAEAEAEEEEADELTPGVVGVPVPLSLRR